MAYRDIHTRAGLPRYCLELSEALARTDEVFLFSRDAGSGIPGTRLFQYPLSFRSMRLEYGPNTLVNSALVGMVKRVLGLDAVITHGGEMIGFDVITAHGTWPGYMRAVQEFAPERIPELRKSMIAAIERINYLSRRYKRIVAVSELTRRELIRDYGVQDDRIDVIPEGVNTDRFRPDSARRRSWRERHGLTDRFVLLHVSTDFAWKGLRTIVKAFPLLQGDPHLVVVGPGNPEPYLSEADPRVRDSITFLGFQESVEDCYAGADLFVFPSRRESFGLSVLEAMSSGLAVVCTRGLGVTDIMTEETDSVLLDRCDDSQELATKVNALGPEERKAIGAAARRTAQAYSWGTVASRIRSVCEACLRR